MESLKDFYYRYLRYFQAKDNNTATSYDKYLALSYAVRSQMVDQWIETQKRYHDSNSRRIYYLSMEYIFGKSLKQNIINLGIEKNVADTARDLGFSLEELYRQEDDFELGNGSKGRLAACIQDAMATLGLPALGYGLRYDYALYHQQIENGMQVEKPYDWLHKGHPWEIIRPEYACIIQFGGKSTPQNGADVSSPATWSDTEKVVAIPYDLPVCGYKNDVVNTLRLWAARATEEFLLDYQNHGDYVRACEEKMQSGRITKILFPEEDVRRTIDFRLKQFYFFISASLIDIVRRYKQDNKDIIDLHKKVLIHLNGSSCALAVPELMRILVDIEQVPWEVAWNITSNVFTYTSHAVSKKSLELWPVYMISQLFPRHMQIIFEVNQRQLDKAREKHSLSIEQVRDLSIIQEGDVKRVRMAHLALFGSFAVNGVSVEQTMQLKTKVFPEFFQIRPEIFFERTNGISHRRWLLNVNAPLARLITDVIGPGWVRNPEELCQLAKYETDTGFLDRFLAVKQEAKKTLVDIFKKKLGKDVPSDALFDVQVTRIHQYKRQVLNILGIVNQYLQIVNGAVPSAVKVHVFGGKAVPTDHMAKQVIHLIHIVADFIAADPKASPFIKIVFVPDYGVTWAEYIVPAANVSEQIALPGKEPDGTNNIKLAFNGALSIVSKAGSNNELIEHVGADNLFVFGKSLAELNAINDYQPYEFLRKHENLKAVIGCIQNRVGTIPSAQAIYPLLSSLGDSDVYYVLLDYDDYSARTAQADLLYTDKLAWAQKCVRTISRMGWFSCDRLINSYNSDVWKLPQV